MLHFCKKFEDAVEFFSFFVNTFGLCIKITLLPKVMMHY